MEGVTEFRTFIHTDTDSVTIHHTQTHRGSGYEPNHTNTVMWTFIISKITTIKDLKPFREIHFVMMENHLAQSSSPDVLKQGGKSVPVPVVEFTISLYLLLG